jgi:hypothetical protein
MSQPHFLSLNLDQPRPDLLRAAGWAVASQTGDYAVAWRGHSEAVFRWQDGAWTQIESRLPGRRAA